MTDEKKEEGTEETTDPTAESKNPETKGEATPGPIPYDRFQEVNKRAKEAEARLQALEKQEKERQAEAEKERAKKLKEQEQFQQLAEEWEEKFNEASPQLEAAQKKLSEFEAIVEAQVAAQRERVPEIYRPLLEAMPLENQLQWLTNNADKLSDEKPRGIPQTPKGTGTPGPSAEDRRARTLRTF